jgi:hypothetical protein
VGSQTKLKVSCNQSWEDSEAEGYGIAVAENGFSKMKAYAYSSITILEPGITSISNSGVQEYTQDQLSILGLNGEPTAFLTLTFECLQCAVISNTNYANYLASVSYGISGSCSIPANGAVCYVQGQITYDPETGQPYTTEVQRNLTVQGSTEVVDGPVGATVTTTVCVGYSAGGCLSIGAATVKASVVNATGKVIKGVTVIGSSGHIYN